jgi:hypothetical protein
VIERPDYIKCTLGIRNDAEGVVRLDAAPFAVNRAAVVAERMAPSSPLKPGDDASTSPPRMPPDEYRL